MGKEAMSNTPSSGIRAFRDFVNGPAGEPCGPRDDPNRKLSTRLTPGLKKDACAGIFKVVVFCENPDDVRVPKSSHKFNGQPVVIADCGTIVRHPELDWLEIGVDVRGFNPVARFALYSCRDYLPFANCHVG